MKIDKESVKKIKQNIVNSLKNTFSTVTQSQCQPDPQKDVIFRANNYENTIPWAKIAFTWGQTIYHSTWDSKKYSLLLQLTNCV